MYYKIAVAEITNFVRGTCKVFHFSGSGFTKKICSFHKYWIPLQAFVRIVPSFQEHLFHRILHNDCFWSWLSLNWRWLNPWYSERLAFPLPFPPILPLLFRVRKVVMGNIFANAKEFYIFTFISIIRFERKFIAWNKFSQVN